MGVHPTMETADPNKASVRHRKAPRVVIGIALPPPSSYVSAEH